MGEEVTCSHFKSQDFQRFERLLAKETDLLESWGANSRLSQRHGVGGLELEMWIIDDQGFPLPLNEELLAAAHHRDIVKELSKFNVEFNVTPQMLAGRGLALLEEELASNWRACEQAAQEVGAHVLAIGILPTVSETHLSLANVSSGERYRALNEQVMRLRRGRPFRLHIEGRETLKTEHQDMMLEAGATSFQIHFQIAAAQAVACFNASILATAPLIALSANAPHLFGKVLWEETRIPLFEQSVDVGDGSMARVSFGTGFAKSSLTEIFRENQESFPVVLPAVRRTKAERLNHLKLHNGTIWRWNRPLVGLDPDGTPHVRIEQRAPSAGPTVVDMAANMAFYFGLTQALASNHEAGTSGLPFSKARTNFYEAARRGWDADVEWIDGWQGKIVELIQDRLLPLAAQGLQQLQVAQDVADRLLGVIDQRVRSRQQGSTWQRRFWERHGRDAALLVREYRERQLSQEPVHTWSI